MIELHDLHRTYHKDGRDIRALEGVTLRIDRGEFVAITGPSGSGKSTLMNVIGLLDRPDSGEYRLEGNDVSALSGDALAALRNRKIGFVFQAFHLLPRTTAVENVELPLVYADHAVPRGLGLRALERVGLADRARHKPGELSGGQQQRVAIARALVLEPDLLLADEPTGNLDSQTGAEIMDIFRTLNQGGTTVIVITHDEHVSRCAQRVLRMADGRIQPEPVHT